MYPDLVLLNGKIITVDKNDSVVEAMAVRFGKIVAVGSNSSIKGLVGDKTEIVDLQGKTVIPGLIDSHCHMISTGISLIMGNLDLSEESGVKSISDVKTKISQKATETPIGEWIIGEREDDSKLAEKRHPNRWELDEAAPNHPVIISTVGGHFSIANTKAFEIGGITKYSSDPVGGVFDRDPDTGELTGGLHEKARDLLLPEGRYGRLPTKDEASEGARRILMANAAAGLTCVYDMVQAAEIRAVLDLKNRRELPIRVRMDVDVELFQDLAKLGIVQGLGDDWVRICGLKMFLDGAVSARTAAVSEPYLNKPDFRGVLSTTEDIAHKTVMDAYKEGYRFSIHANGDRAIKMCLDILEEAQKTYQRSDSRNRIIHCSVVNPDLIQRIKKLNLLPTIFGAYAYYHGDKILPAFGTKRLEYMFAARSFLDQGVIVSAHSDHTASPFAPMMGIHSLVNRTTKAGEPIGQNQRVSVMEALKLYTINAAYQSFDEDSLGSIEVGKCADMVILGKDLFNVPKEEIISVPIETTVIAGKVVYNREKQ